MVLQFTGAVTFPKLRGYPGFVWEGAPSLGQHIPGCEKVLLLSWRMTSDAAQEVRRVQWEQLLLLKRGRNIQGELHQAGNWAERRRPSPGIKKKVPCQWRRWEGGAGWFPKSGNSSPDTSYDALKWGHTLLMVILNTAVTTVPCDIFQIWFIKVSCK